MSTGKFVDAIYETDAGTDVSIRVQPETITAWNPVGAGTPTPGYPSAQVSQGKRALGINARTARFKWAAAPGGGYDPNGIITLPIFTKAAYDNLVKGIDYAYGTTGLNLVGKTAETIK